MKQSVRDQMQKYQHKQKVVEATQYKEGMEDAWLVEYSEYIKDNEGTSNNRVDKLFWTKESAEEYMKHEHLEDNCRGLFCEYTEVIPVLLREISEAEYKNDCLSITQDCKYYDYEELTNDSWIVIGENGYIYSEYSTEMFFDDYEPLSAADVSAFIGCDKDLKELYVEINDTMVIINDTEIATVEKLLEGFSIPYTERVGQAFLDRQ